MKKTAIILCLICAFIAIRPIKVQAISVEAQQAAQIKEMVLSDNKVVSDVACIIFAGSCGIALKCGSIYFQEQKNQLKSGIIDAVKIKYPELRNIVVKIDFDLFLKTKKIEQKLNDGASVFSLKDDIINILRLAEQRE